MSKTFLFLFPTVTPLPSSTLLPGIIIQNPGAGVVGEGTAVDDSVFTGKEWTCAIRGKSPPMGAVIGRGVSFYVSITLFNTGTKTWTNNGVDFVYKGGFRVQGRRIQDLPFSIATGQQITLQSLLVAPKTPDTYNTYWDMMVGRTTFCGVKYTFEVK